MKKILVTGDALFLRRYKPLFEEMERECKDLNYLIGDRRFEIGVLNQAVKILNKLIYLASPLYANRREKNAMAFMSKSKRLEQKIRQLSDRPDYVMHVFGMYCPFWEQFDIPYGMLLDYTMSLVKKNWTPWSSFTNDHSIHSLNS